MQIKFLIEKLKLFIALERLKRCPRHTPGKIKINDWIIHYVDNRSLISNIEILVQRKTNNFISSISNPYIIDCGANIGISVLNYKRLYPKAEIIAFEPDPNLAEILRINLKANEIIDIQIVEAAVWIKDGSVPFFLEGTDGGRVNFQDHTLKNTEVAAVELGRYLIKRVDLLKMDIEGAEFVILPAIAEKLSYVKNILIECHMDMSKIEDFANLLSVLGKAGFSCSVNTYGPWRDLIHSPTKLPVEFDQYILVCGWKNEPSE